MSEQVLVTSQAQDGIVRLSFDEALYPRDAILGAAYVLMDRAFVHLDHDGAKILVSVRAKPGVALDAPAIAGEFENEALAQAWRREIIQENRALIESTTARAVGGAAGPPGLDDLLDASLGDLGDAFDDPLGIAVSWEEKYGKKAAEPQEQAPKKAPEEPQEQAPKKEPEEPQEPKK
jgi:His-Xaa-Ser system protein HxsD